MRKLLLAGLALLLSSCASTPPGQDVRPLGRLYISGAAGEGDMPAAVRSAYERLGRTLAANGLTFANVVKESVRTTDVDAFEATKELRKTFYGANLPAATFVEVRRLFLPSSAVEIELVAEEAR